jgi:hypothetical protein
MSARTKPCDAAHWCDELNDTCILYGDGDFDNDGDVDLFDFGWFQWCCDGTAHNACEPANFSGDEKVDLADYAGFEAVLGGPQ